MIRMLIGTKLILTFNKLRLKILVSVFSNGKLSTLRRHMILLLRLYNNGFTSNIYDFWNFRAKNYFTWGVNGTKIIIYNLYLCVYYKDQHNIQLQSTSLSSLSLILLNLLITTIFITKFFVFTKFHLPTSISSMIT